MIDMGFEPAVIQILDSMVAPGKRPLTCFQQQCPPNRTIGEKVFGQSCKSPNWRQVADEHPYSTRPCHRFESSGENKAVIQNFETTSGPIIVFVNTKSNSESVYDHVLRFGYRAVLLHGGKEQVQREKLCMILKMDMQMFSLQQMLRDVALTCPM